MEANWRKSYFRYKSFFLNIASQYKERSDWRAYLEILLSLATVSIFSIFALRPTVLTIAGLIKQIDEKKQTIQKMDAKIQNLSKAQIIYDQERGNITLLEQTVIPKNISSEVFTRQIEGLSSKHQVSMDLINIGAAAILGAANINANKPEITSAADGSTHASFSFSVDAPIDQYTPLSDFLADFSKLRRPVQIDKVEYKAGETEEKREKILILTVKGSLPYFP